MARRGCGMAWDGMGWHGFSWVDQAVDGDCLVERQHQFDRLRPVERHPFDS